MPYATNADLPAAVRSKLKGKKLRQWRHVWNSAYSRHGDESRAFAEAWATVQKASIAMTDFNFFMPIGKINKDKRTVSGYASTPTRDSDGEIVTLEAVRDALPDYMTWRNIREMHALKAVGTAEEANLDSQGLYLTAKIVDDSAWKKCLEGVYKGFSIGGRKLAKAGDKITKLEMTEISVVDRPANPDCRISIAKSATVALGSEGYLVRPKVKLNPEQKAMAQMAEVVQKLAKAGAAKDGLSLPAEKKAKNVSPKDDSIENNKFMGGGGDGGMAAAKDGGGGIVAAAGDKDKVACKAHGVIDCPKCALEKKDEDDKPGNAPQSEVESPTETAEKREFSSDERKDLAGEGKALPDGSFPIENVEDLRNAIQAFGRAKDKAKAKAHIKARARALGQTALLPDTWSKAAKAERRLAEAKLSAALGLGEPSFLTLQKGMRTAAGLAYCFDSIRDAQRSLMLEGQREGGDKKDQKLAKQLGAIAKQLAALIGQKATHEAGEAEDMSDVDDLFVNQILGDDKMAAAKVSGGAAVAVSDSTGDPLTDALAALMKRAAEPSRKARLGMAEGNVKECRKAMKECRKAIEDAHKMHKAAFLSKAAKRDKKPDDDDDDDKEFDHTGAMEKLQKAYSELEKARTFGKAAIGNIQKAAGLAGRAGQRGQETSDADSPWYEVPRGVKDLAPSELATASPGGDEKGGAPPMYPDDGAVYPGKAAGLGDLAKYVKDGQVPAAIVELLVKGAKAEAELEAIKRLPAAPAGGRRPYAFDLTKVTAGAGGAANPRDVGAVLFAGVDTNALNSGDERAHAEASAKVIGNLITSGQFGKSVFDPAFKGAAGSAR